MKRFFCVSRREGWGDICISRAVLLGAAVLCCAPRGGAAATITMDTVIDARHSFIDEPVVIADGPGGPTTVHLVEGGILGRGVTLTGSSRLEISGGQVRRPLTPSGGPNQILDAVTLTDSSQLLMTGGHVIADSRVRSLNVLDSAAAVITGGQLVRGALQTHDAAGVTIGGDAEILDRVLLRDTSRLTITGGALAVGIRSSDLAIVEITGGQVARDISVSNILRLSGGRLFNDEGRRSRISAANLEVVGVDLGLERLFETPDSLIYLRLTGAFTDGETLNNVIFSGPFTNIVLTNVLEPGAVVLLLCGVLALPIGFGWRRRERTIPQTR